MSEKKRSESREPSVPGQFNCVIVTGLPGSGKTTCGKLLSKRLGYRFIDSDKLIERSEGMTVRDIFSRLGEPHFRTLEREILRLIERRLSTLSTLRPGHKTNETDGEQNETDGDQDETDGDQERQLHAPAPGSAGFQPASTPDERSNRPDKKADYIPTTGIEGSVAIEMLRAVQAKGLVLSVGGGMPEPEENRELLKRIGTVVYLFSDPNEIASRLKEDGNRPLLSKNAKWSESSEQNGSNKSNDGKFSVQITNKNQSITSEKLSSQKISSKVVPDRNNPNEPDSIKSTPDNPSSTSPDNASTQLLQRLQELLDRRRQAYECADITIDTSGLAPHQIVNRLQEALKTHQQIL